MESVVKILREQNRYTQTRLAQILGISRPALINYENMEQDLPLFVVKELSKLFNVSYECLIDNKLPDSETEDDKESLNKICKWYTKLKQSEKVSGVDLQPVVEVSEDVSKESDALVESQNETVVEDTQEKSE